MEELLNIPVKCHSVVRASRRRKRKRKKKKKNVSVMILSP